MSFTFINKPWQGISLFVFTSRFYYVLVLCTGISLVILPPGLMRTNYMLFTVSMMLLQFIAHLECISFCTILLKIGEKNTQEKDIKTKEAMFNTELTIQQKRHLVFTRIAGLFSSSWISVGFTIFFTLLLSLDSNIIWKIVLLTSVMALTVLRLEVLNQYMPYVHSCKDLLGIIPQELNDDE